MALVQINTVSTVPANLLSRFSTEPPGMVGQSAEPVGTIRAVGRAGPYGQGSRKSWQGRSAKCLCTPLYDRVYYMCMLKRVDQTVQPANTAITREQEVFSNFGFHRQPVLPVQRWFSCSTPAFNWIPIKLDIYLPNYGSEPNGYCKSAVISQNRCHRP